MSAEQQQQQSIPKMMLIQNDKDNVTLNVTVYPSKKKITTTGKEEEEVESIILLHGGPGVPDDMISIVHLLNTNYQIINFEQRGTGSSFNPRKDYSIQGYINDINVIANALQLSKFHLFGHSWGGLYAQIYAEQQQTNTDTKLLSLFLCSPSSGTNIHWEQTETEVLTYNKDHSSGWDFLKMGWYSLWGMLGYDTSYQSMFQLVLKAYHKDFILLGGKEEDDEGKKEKKEEDNNQESSHPLQAVKADPINLTRPNIVQYPLLTKMEHPPFPIMITYGATDVYGKSQDEVPKRYPTAKYCVIENCGHIPWLHNPSKFTTILKEFYSLQEQLVE